MPRFAAGTLLAGIVILSITGAPAYGVMGACCIPPSYQCFELSRDQCNQVGGDWLGDNTICSPNP